ncbi:MAG: prolyl oligopeptidase family serine peptidase [Phycisphaerales bacterium]|nr:prolyl oligopeptidase family serine peptidase [Phycisphaerales bacterium]
MDPRFLKLPKSLQERSETIRIGEVPALIARPESDGPVPAVIWMHGRTVYKELDPGRYQRWIRSGIAAVALDLPGHGERYIEEYHAPNRTVDLIAQGVGEIDSVVEWMRDEGGFDMERIAIGGMSAGGMVTLSRLCNPHPFVAACVEGTTGNLHELYFPSNGEPGRGWLVEHDEDKVDRVDPMQHMGGFRPIPLLALHNEGDELVPISVQRSFLDALRGHYIERCADPGLIELHSFTDTGAPQEHAGFGRRANDAKNLQLEFLRRVFGLDAFEADNT